MSFFIMKSTRIFRRFTNTISMFFEEEEENDFPIKHCYLWYRSWEEGWERMHYLKYCSRPTSAVFDAGFLPPTIQSISEIAADFLRSCRSMLRYQLLFKNGALATRRSSQNNTFTRFITTKPKNPTRDLEWKTVVTRFVPIGLCLVAVMQWRLFRRRQGEKLASQWEISCYCLLPLRTVSRCWGFLADINLPVFLRPSIYKLYANTFGVNLSEAQNEDLTSYSSLADFFARPLKEGVRLVDTESCLVAPCDGTVLHLGKVDTEQVEQVKGVTYSLKDFLGEQSSKKVNNGDFRSSLLHKPHDGNTLYQCVIYLAPGDYHRFHSPAEWQPTHRRHVSGQLLSVNPKVAKWLPGLFCINERAVYLGQWEHGFFSYTAVGATNVGTVNVYFDKSLQTNQPKKSNQCREHCLGSGIELKRGEIVGEFRMGSTIVLIFEAPLDFRFNISPGERVKMGQSLGCIGQQKFVDRITNEKIHNYIRTIN